MSLTAHASPDLNSELTYEHRYTKRDQLEVAVASLRAAVTETQRSEVAARLDTGFAPMRWVGAAIPLPA